MSVPECLLDEDECCADHGRYLPCVECRVEQADQWAEWKQQDVVNSKEEALL